MGRDEDRARGQALFSKLPCPKIRVLLRKSTFEHIDHVLSDDWEELEAMIRAGSGYIQALRSRVGGDAEIQVSGNTVPTTSGSVTVVRHHAVDIPTYR